jgi:hypothetical protein
MPRRDKISLGEKVFWTLVAISSIGAGLYGYQRFKLIRPDLYDPRYKPTVSESEREARIADYQQQGDALSRARGQATFRKLKSGEACQNGFIVRWERPKRESDFLVAFQIIENGQPVRCDMSATPVPQ